MYRSQQTNSQDLLTCLRFLQHVRLETGKGLNRSRAELDNDQTDLKKPPQLLDPIHSC